MNVKCAWCGVLVEDNHSTKTSHGICLECVVTFFEDEKDLDINKFFENMNKQRIKIDK